MNWMFFAFLSAVFAALTSILAKIGIKDVDSNLATAVRTVVILAFAWGIVLFQGKAGDIFRLTKFSIIFLVLSGIATGLSWLFYFRALQLGEASKVVPIDKLSLVLTVILAALFLGEKPTMAVVGGSLLMTAGALVIALVK
jgi:bacterial/archaeal transporter family protein